MFASLAVATALAAQPAAQTAVDFNAPVNIRASVAAADLSGPHAVITLVEEGTGRRFIAEGLHSLAVKRMGFDGGRLVGQTVGFEGLRYLGGAACVSDCRVKVRSLTFPDGTKVFLGVSRPAATAPASTISR